MVKYENAMAGFRHEVTSITKLRMQMNTICEENVDLSSRLDQMDNSMRLTSGKVSNIEHDHGSRLYTLNT